MTKPMKIALSQSRDIPLDRLVMSNRNVRRARTGLSIEDLAEDIARRTLLQSLSVRAISNRDGYFEVQAGGRRYRALELLVRQKRLAKDAPIPCIIREDGLQEEDSLAENVQRLNLHPLDQFRAFQALRDQGLGEEDIAARFFVTPQIVRQRLKLAAISSTLLEAYAADHMSLEQLMAFTISGDPARQEQVWEAVRHGTKAEPYTIRKLLTENTVHASDRRARFIGLQAYQDAGGVILRDLFSYDDGGWLQDVVLLDRLVAAKLTLAADRIRGEGWKWVQADPEFPYGHTAGLHRLAGSPGDDDQARRDTLWEEKEDIEREYCREDGEDIPQAIQQRLAEISYALEAPAARPIFDDPEKVACAGAFVSIGGNGELKVERGYIRPEDLAPLPVETKEGAAPEIADVSAVFDGALADMGAASALGPDDEGEEDGLKPLSERLIMELTAHRTLALRDALAGDPATAFLAVLHSLVLQTFWRYPTANCLEIRSTNSRFTVQGPGLAECPSARAIDDRHSAWVQRLGQDPDRLWDALCSFDTAGRMALFAHCASLTLNAVQEPWNRAPNRRRHADQIAQALALDMTAAGWIPTAINYLNRVPKARILEAVTQAKGIAAAELIGHLKKSDMAEQAERLLAGTGWLPDLLRTPEAPCMPAADTGIVPSETAGDLPAFLTAAE